MPACKNDHLISEIQLSDILHFLIFFTSLAKSSLLYIFCHIYTPLYSIYRANTDFFETVSMK